MNYFYALNFFSLYLITGKVEFSVFLILNDTVPFLTPLVSSYRLHYHTTPNNYLRLQGQLLLFT